nr:4'-phosphopantetheinyl transferase superfamily protein [Clostridium beijerinckii]
MNQKNIYFNISHSGEWVICAVGDFQSGIDIEKVKKSDLSFAKSIYSKEEYEYLLNIPEEEQAKMFCKIWTLKESYVKYIGQGLRTPFNSFFFKFKDENVKLYIDKKEENNLKFFTDKLDELHYLSLCVNKQDEKNVNFNITKLTLSKLLSWSRTINNL